MSRPVFAPLVAVVVLASSIGGCRSDAPMTPEPDAVREASGAVVYGDDDRTDWYASDDEALKALTSNAIVALVRPFNIDTSNPAGFTPVGDTLGDRRDLCDGERFTEQPTMAFCSGTLIDDDLVLTAGHCVDDAADCENTRFVFDYYFAEAGELEPITAEDVYSCGQIVARRLQDGLDYAVVQLDRPVEGDRIPAPVRAGDEPLAIGDALTVIGFGSGLPAKIDAGGAVTDPRADRLDYFGGTPDTFGGNSGSGVFNANGEVVGILVRGATDYVDDGTCTRVNVLSQDGDGNDEDMVYVARAIEALCETSVASSLCDGRGGYCRPCSLDDECLDGFFCGLDPDAGVQYCTQGCIDDGGCRADHTCVEERCVPEQRTECSGDDVVSVNACGAEIGTIASCEGGEFCVEGACAEPGEGNTCETAVALELGAAAWRGELTANAYSDDFDSGCGGSGIDRVFSFTIEGFDQAVAFELSGFDTVLSLRETCDRVRSLVDCNDDSNPPGGRGSRVEATLSAGTYYLVAESFQFDEGPITLAWTADTVCPCEVDALRCDGAVRQRCVAGPICPDWVDEPCDAGNTCVDGACVAQAAGDTCEDAIPLTVESVRGDFGEGLADVFAPSCAVSGADAVYAVDLAEPSAVTIRLASEDGASVSARRTCADVESETACAVVREGQGEQTFETQAGPLYVVVDAGAEGGAYTLTVTTAPICSDQCGPEGELTCLDGGEYRACGQFDEDSCLDFGPTEMCPENTDCRPEGCIPRCEDACETEGAALCGEDGGVYECLDQDRDGCLDLVPSGACDAGEVCDDGACVDEPVDCETACDVAVCGSCPGDEVAGGSGSGCMASAGGSAPLGWGLVVLGLVALRRRARDGR